MLAVSNLLRVPTAISGGARISSECQNLDILTVLPEQLSTDGICLYFISSYMI